MTLIVVLFLAGVALLAIDLFLSSLLLAVCGSILILGGAARLYETAGAAPALVAGIAALLLLAATIYAEVVVLPRTRLGRGMVVESTSGAPPIPEPAALIGRAGYAVTILAPSGYVEIDGRRYEAFCQSGHAAVGTALRVVGLDSFRVIVAPLVSA